jgi:hypothetical protein
VRINVEIMLNLYLIRNRKRFSPLKKLPKTLYILLIQMRALNFILVLIFWSLFLKHVYIQL